MRKQFNVGDDAGVGIDIGFHVGVRIGKSFNVSVKLSVLGIFHKRQYNFNLKV